VNELEEIREAILEREVDKIDRLVKKALDKGIPPLKALEAMTDAMKVVGERFDENVYFLADLIMAAETFNSGLKILKPLLKTDLKLKSIASVVIGTVEGDIHDIGKNIVATLLTSAGFTVHDLGVDVQPKKFVEKAKETHAQIVGLSALLTPCLEGMRATVEELKTAGLKDDVKVIVGGSAVTNDYAKKIGADGYSADAVGAVEVCKKLVEKS